MTLSPALHTLLLFVHLLGVVVWVGGMAFAHFVMRPTAVALLEPPLRLAFLSQALGRFFDIVSVAVVAILASGLAVMLSVGMARAPVAWHLMLTLGLAMAVVFAFIRLGLYPRLQRAVAGSDWAVAAAALGAIRQRVFFNLCLGVLTMAVAASARAL